MSTLSFLIVPEQRIHECFSIEYLQVLHAFAQANVFDRNPEMVGNTDDYTAFGRPVELRNGQRIDFRCGGKLLSLLKSVLSRRSV